MRLLLDTHILLWALLEPFKLTDKVQAALKDPDNEVLFSTASVWEMAIKAALGRLDFNIPPDRVFEAALASNFIELPIQSRAALKVASLPHHHRDPFDRLLVAQAMTEPALLYTADKTLKLYSELVICI